MPALLRVKVRWSGFIGSPGYSVFHFMSQAQGSNPSADAQGAVDITSTWCNGIKDLLPHVGTLQVMGDVEEISESDNKIQNIYPCTQPPATSSSASQFESYAGPVGAVVNWRTAGVRKGRRVHGKTFLVPLTSNAFENNGTLAAATVATIQSASNTLVNGAFDAPSLGVYCRPTTKGATDGIFWDAGAATVPDLAVVLRSRRD